MTKLGIGNLGYRRFLKVGLIPATCAISFPSAFEIFFNNFNYTPLSDHPMREKWHYFHQYVRYEKHSFYFQRVKVLAKGSNMKKRKVHVVIDIMKRTTIKFQSNYRKMYDVCGDNVENWILHKLVLVYVLVNYSLYLFDD